MRLVILNVPACGSCRVLTSAQQAPRTPAEPVVVVIGEGLVQAVPDRAWITIGAESARPARARRSGATPK